MERQFYNEDFERLLRDNANQYRMYPSEKVWKGIRHSLHARRRWYRLSGLLVLLLGGSLATIFLGDKPSAKNNITAANTASESTPALNREAISSLPAPAYGTSASQNVQAPVIDMASYSGIKANPEATTTSQVTGQEQHQEEPVQLVISAVAPDEKDIPEVENHSLQVISAQAEKINQENSLSLPGLADNSFQELNTGNAEETTLLPDREPAELISMERERMLLALASRTAPIQVTPRHPRVTAQVYFTPTVSYRKLSENKNYTASQAGLNYNLVDINKVVDHKPAMGLEVGIEGRYSITERLAVKTGAQFNINRYDIRAYFHPTELATIALNSGFGPDSLMTLSNYRNFSGETPNWLENFYFTMSLPLGAEFILADNGKMQWGISGSVQPSYVIGQQAYLISSDYKHYAKMKDLMRRWNISTDFEAFVSYSTGRLRWQVGPQVRYQHLSSFVNQYPVKENLFDIGLKIAAGINKK